MRYTRYNHNKKKNNNNNTLKFILSMLAGIVLSCMIGLAVACIIWKVLPVNDSKPSIAEGNDESNTVVESTNEENDAVIENEGEKSEFYFIQCGFFSKKDNAEQVLSKISSEKGAFIAEDGDKFRVFAGSYNKDNVDSKISELSGKGVESVKVSVALNGADEVEAQVSAICDGYLKILNTTFNSDVKSVNTTEFKEWVKALEEVKDGNNLETLKQLKDYIQSLPEEINKDKVSEEISYLYKILLIFK